MNNEPGKTSLLCSCSRIRTVLEAQKPELQCVGAGTGSNFYLLCMLSHLWQTVRESLRYRLSLSLSTLTAEISAVIAFMNLESASLTPALAAIFFTSFTSSCIILCLEEFSSAPIISKGFSRRDSQHRLGTRTSRSSSTQKTKTAGTPWHPEDLEDCHFIVDERSTLHKDLILTQ
ncbi:hypothetical protein C1H46_007612 [Malus baccata]|uniref:Uncharacterized protein n=1 Tax=Malus baccata TaxID=106549 RepID=A0A540N861_MALBA|nr:hypothetical protein C1H46_007612 [Malus baccata]